VQGRSSICNNIAKELVPKLKDLYENSVRFDDKPENEDASADIETSGV
jgi:hypothetical protein